jgi:23S rRNA (uridine2479-2'-O)-methyltransferase
VPRNTRISVRNARFQQWQALLASRQKRQRTGEFLVHGVRPLTIAVQRGWPVHALIYEDGRPLSQWAKQILRDTAGRAEQVAMTTELITELGEKAEEPPELLAVAAIPPDDYARIATTADFLGLAFDRPSSPGNIGTLVRSADAFGAAGVVVTGHAADPYDPKSVRASTGSLFAVPVVRDASPQGVLAWVDSLRRKGLPVAVVGTDEHGTAGIADHDLTRPALLVVGNETSGLSAAWREACDVVLRIPITGTASSLNAANAGTIALYEAARQRGFAAGRPPGWLLLPFPRPLRQWDVSANVNKETAMEARITYYDSQVGSKFSKYINSAGTVVSNSTLPAATQELVKIRASQINGCAMCLDMHTKDAAHAGETQARLNMVAAWREAKVFTDAERAALALTEQGTRLADGAGVTDEAWTNAAKYYDEDQLAALVSLIAVINTYNRMNVLTRQPAGDYQPGQW